MTEVSVTGRSRWVTLLWWVLGSVVLLGGAFASAVAFVIHDQNNPVGTAKLKLNELEKALQRYDVQMGEIPSQNEGLSALLQPPDGSKPFLREKDVPRDPWGEAYLYYNPARGGNAPYELASKGPDRQEGTDDDIMSVGK